MINLTNKRNKLCIIGLIHPKVSYAPFHVSSKVLFASDDDTSKTPSLVGSSDPIEGSESTISLYEPPFWLNYGPDGEISFNTSAIVEALQGESKETIDAFFNEIVEGVINQAQDERDSLGDEGLDDLETIDAKEASDLKDIREIKGLVYDYNDLSPSTNDNDNENSGHDENNPNDVEDSSDGEDSGHHVNNPNDVEDSRDVQYNTSNVENISGVELNSSNENKSSVEYVEGLDKSVSEPIGVVDSSNKRKRLSSSDIDDECSRPSKRLCNTETSKDNNSSPGKPEEGKQSPIDFVLELKSTELPPITDSDGGGD
jgi:hypothetical protein